MSHLHTSRYSDIVPLKLSLDKCRYNVSKSQVSFLLVPFASDGTDQRRSLFQIVNKNGTKCQSIHLRTPFLFFYRTVIERVILIGWYNLTNYVIQSPQAQLLDSNFCQGIV